MMTEDIDSVEEIQEEALQPTVPSIPPQDILYEGELNSEEILARTILYALDEGAEKLRQSGCFDPFTILIRGEELFIEDHSGSNEEGSYASANRTILLMEKIGDAYVFCYDGLVDLDSGQSDALIVEYANKGDEQAQINIRLYQVSDGEYVFDEPLYQAGETESFFKGMTSRALFQIESEAEDDELGLGADGESADGESAGGESADGEPAGSGSTGSGSTGTGQE